LGSFLWMSTGFLPKYSERNFWGESASFDVKFCVWGCDVFVELELWLGFGSGFIVVNFDFGFVVFSSHEKTVFGDASGDSKCLKKFIGKEKQGNNQMVFVMNFEF